MRTRNSRIRPTRGRAALLLVGVVVVACVAATMLIPGSGSDHHAGSSSSPGATVDSTSGWPFFTGTITDKSGRPISGPMFVTAMPDDVSKDMETYVVATAQADANGHYEVTVTDTARVQQLAAEQEGVVDFAIASQLPGVEGSGFVSGRVVGSGDALRLVDPAPGASKAPKVVDFQANDRRAAQQR
ncbi:MAG: hypothetical protein QM679_02330 [Patulibacter sp.]